MYYDELPLPVNVCNFVYYADMFTECGLAGLSNWFCVWIRELGGEIKLIFWKFDKSSV